LEQEIRAIAERERCSNQSVLPLSSKRTALAALREKLERAGENLALAEGPDEYRAVRKVFEQLKIQEKLLQAQVQQLEEVASKAQDIDAEIAAALDAFDRMPNLATAAQDLSTVGTLFRQFNARLFLRFTEVCGKKRSLNKLFMGFVAFDEKPAPVALYQGPTGRTHVKSPATTESVAGPVSLESPGIPGCVSGQEGDSLGNVHRGDWI
jgi:hypothetical protein